MSRILLLHEDAREPGQGGGAESLLRDITRSLRTLGHEVAWLQSPHIEQAVDQYKPDLVHVQTIHNFVGMAPVTYLQEQHIPHVWAVMDYWPFCTPRMLLVDGDRSCSAVAGNCQNECGGRRGDLLDIVNNSPVVALNEYTADIYRRNGMRCDYTVELGVDTEMFAPDHGKRDTEPSVYTSSAWPEYAPKGMRYLLQAVEGTDITANLMAHTTRQNVAAGLSRASIYVFPSVYQETWGLCLNEAMASGCAVIASDVAGARAQIHAELGMLVPPRDPRVLREALEYLIARPALVRLMGEAARAHVVEDHSLEAMGRRWEAVYQSVLGRVAVTA